MSLEIKDRQKQNNISRRKELFSVSVKQIEMFIGTIIVKTIGDVGGICVG